MKKILLSVFALLTVFVLTGCVEIATTTTPEITTTTTTGTGPTTKVVMDLPDEPVEITFWHVYGQDKSALLDELILEFEEMYPNVTITSTSQTDYNTLKAKIDMGISVGQVPTMAIGYPDHFAGYVQAGAAYSLNNFINSNVRYEIIDSTSSIFGEFVDVAIELDDFIPGYLAENNQYVGGQYYSMPYSKSTEMMAINRTVLKQHITAIRNAGITISDEGFFSHTTPLTFNQVQQLAGILLNTTAVTDVAANKFAFLLNYDSSGNMFINMSRQWNAGYTNSAGEILVDNNTTKSMLNYINAMFNQRVFVLPNQWSQNFGSDNFKAGDIAMTVGSTAGVLYNIPNSKDKFEHKFGLFDVDFLPVPQTATESSQAVTLSDGTTNYNITSSLSAVQQGPNIGIFKQASTNEKLFAWLLIQHLTSTENTVKWAIDTGYLPVRLSAFTSTVEVELSDTIKMTYTDFMDIAVDFWAADGLIDWESTDVRRDYIYKSMVANIAKNQALYYQYDPAFAAGSSSAGSATVRLEAGYCLENIFNKTYTPIESLSFFKNQVDW